MAILRAGPWGNLTDSFQPVPSNTSVPLDHYPVNCAKANWPNQLWAAYYELTEAGCCTPQTITFDRSYNMETFYGYYGPYTATRVDLLDPPLSPLYGYDACHEYYFEHPSGPYYGQVWFYQSAPGGSWSQYEATSSAIIDSASGTSSDDCDPTGTYTQSFWPYTVVTVTTP